MTLSYGEAPPRIRSVTPADLSVLHAMTRELAEYQHAVEPAKATEKQFHEALFSDCPAAFALIAEEAGRPVGFALWFHNFSTSTGTHGIYLEDLYVRPEARGRGHGKNLLARLARLCEERRYQRFQWSVLNWNTPSIDFYTALGAQSLDGQTTFQLSGEPLRALARINAE